MVTIAAISQTHILTAALGGVAAALAALVIACVFAIVKIKKKEDKLLRSNVYVHVLRPKPSIAQKQEKKEEPVKEEKKEKNAAQKRGKKNKKPKYVFKDDSAEKEEERGEPQGEEKPSMSSDGESGAKDKKTPLARQDEDREKNADDTPRAEKNSEESAGGEADK